MSLTQKTISGIIWNFAEQIGRKGISVIITLMLARFLVPADYGLVAMMAVFLAVATSLMDSGFTQALIRLPDATPSDFDTAFYANLALGFLAYMLLFLAAPLIAGFYDESRLTLLIRVAGINILIHAFQVIQRAVLSRELNFKVQLQASLPAGIISGTVAIILAYNGFGVWALIVQMLLSSFILTLLLWKLQGWRPGLSFSKTSLESMYNFGYKLFLSVLLNIVFENIYVIVIAKLFATATAGYYFFADKLKNLVVSQFVSSIQAVTYPALSSLQTDDTRLKAGYKKVIQVTTFIFFPVILTLAALTDPLFKILLPEKWYPAVLYLQLMCLANVTYPLHLFNLNVLKVKSRSDLFLYLEIFKKTLIAIVLFMSVKFGVIGILIGQIIISVFAYIPNSYFSAKLINYPVREQMEDFMPCLALSSSVALIVYFTGLILDWPSAVELCILAIFAGLLYLAGAYLLKLQGFTLAKQMMVERMLKRKMV
jgi:O-antigen/teichoic acid export membrane protein